jgi:hypothetical protein
VFYKLEYLILNHLALAAACYSILFEAKGLFTSLPASASAPPHGSQGSDPPHDAGEKGRVHGVELWAAPLEKGYWGSVQNLSHI